MKKHFLSFVCLIIVATLQLQGEERNFLQKKADIAKIKEVLVMNQEWVPYPDYTDRAGWDELLGEFKESIIKNGEKYLNYEYKVIKATDYLEYERSGSREIMSKPSSANNTAVSALIGAELAEGKGRFIEPIINGVFYLCEKTSWASSAHTAAYQKTRRAIPDHREHIMDLGHGGTAQMLSWTYYFLHKEFLLY